LQLTLLLLLQKTRVAVHAPFDFTVAVFYFCLVNNMTHAQLPRIHGGGHWKLHRQHKICVILFDKNSKTRVFMRFD